MLGIEGYVVRVEADSAAGSPGFAIIGLSAFLGIPVAYLVGDRLFRRAPQAPLVLAAVSITAYGGLLRGRNTGERRQRDRRNQT